MTVDLNGSLRYVCTRCGLRFRYRSRFSAHLGTCVGVLLTVAEVRK